MSVRFTNALEWPLCFAFAELGEGFEDGVLRDLFEGDRLEPGETRSVPHPGAGWVGFVGCGGMALADATLLEETAELEISEQRFPPRRIHGYWIHNRSDRPVCRVLYSANAPRGDEIVGHLGGEVIAPGEALLFPALAAYGSGVLVAGCGHETVAREHSESAGGIVRVRVEGVDESAAKGSEREERRGVGAASEAPRGFVRRLVDVEEELSALEKLLREGLPATASRRLRRAVPELADLREEFMLSEAEITENDRRALGGGDPIRPAIPFEAQVELLTAERRARILGAAILAAAGREERSLDLYRLELDSPIEAPFHDLDPTPQLELQAELSIRLSRLLRRLGSASEALEQARRARRLARRAGAIPLRAESLLEEGRNLLEMERPAEGGDLVRRSAELAERFGDLPLQVRALHALHLAAAAEGDPAAARELARTALDQARRAGDGPVLVTALAAHGRLLLERGEPGRARDHLREALDTLEGLETSTGLEEVLLALGSAELRAGEEAAGFSRYRRALDLFELRRAELGAERLRSAYGAGVAAAYQEMVTALWDAGRHPEAFEVMERSRARTLEARLADPGPGAIAVGPYDEKLQRAIERLRRRVDEMHERSRHGRAAKKELVEVHRRLELLLVERQRLLRGGRRVSPISPAGRSGPEDLRRIRTALTQDSRLIEYFVARDRVLVLVVSPDSVRPFTLQTSAEELTAKVRLLRTSIADQAGVQPQLRELYDRLIRPLEPALDAEHWLIVPHGNLHSVPFAALHDGRSWLGDRVGTSVLPRAGLLPRLEAPWKGSGRAGVVAMGGPEVDGLPRLEHARREVEAVASIAGVRPLLGSAASETALRELAPRAGVIHLAVHGHLHPTTPLFSSLRLRPGDGDDGRLEVHEIENLDLVGRTDLVVLSACSTRQGPRDAGQEILSLSRGFLAAGARSVVSSAWRVEDEATALLMEGFYRHLQQGLGKVEALRRAQADLRDSRSGHGHPYYWAGFLLTGHGGPLAVRLQGGR